MCGIAGCIEPRAASLTDLADRARAMADAIAHRGPDDQGVWLSGRLGLALAHRRLSIVDLSAQGHQPMISASGRYVVAFNGEFYNFRELRSQLEAAGCAPRWRGDSDTEVFLAACEAWGIERTLQRVNGMFAIALLDQQRNRLILVRDRLGEKPLYFGLQGGMFLFGSELKALRAHPAFVADIDPEAVTLYFRFGYVPTPLSIYRTIRKLEPGHFVEIACDGAAVSVAAPVCYWTLPTAPTSRAVSEAQAAEELDHLLTDAVRVRMHADVPLGAFLSGGIDSSCIVAMMQKQSIRPVRTFSIGFAEEAQDESAHARAVAQALGTAHTELRVTAQDALQVVGRLPGLYDEPFADSSQIPTYLLAALTREHVTVSLSGDAGDEVFGGYNRYVQGQRLLHLYKWAPRCVRTMLARALRSVSASRAESLLRRGPRSLAVMFGDDRLMKLSEVIDRASIHDAYKRLVSSWPQPTQLCLGRLERETIIDDPALRSLISSPIAWMMYVDQRTYLPDDILVKVDRATMAVALEGRIPFLDPRIIEYAAALPLSFKFRDGQGKWLLRQVLYRYLDRRHFDRPKQGFAIPLAAWLRGPLRAWAEELLSERELRGTGVVDVQLAREAWRAHVAGERNLQQPLWTLLMFQAWCAQ
jgi:asparagine synthase (glutamine-hydrolysing)